MKNSEPEMLEMLNYSIRYAIEDFCEQNFYNDVDDFIMTEITGVINEDTTTSEWVNIYRTSPREIQKINAIKEVITNIMEVSLRKIYGYNNFNVTDYIMTKIINNPSEKMLEVK